MVLVETANAQLNSHLGAVVRERSRWLRCRFCAVTLRMMQRWFMMAAKYTNGQYVEGEEFLAVLIYHRVLQGSMQNGKCSARMHRQMKLCNWTLLVHVNARHKRGNVRVGGIVPFCARNRQQMWKLPRIVETMCTLLSGEAFSKGGTRFQDHRLR